MFWARPNQKIPDGEWVNWVIMAGRGFGKTRTGAETIRQWKNQGYKRFAFIANTPADARDIMIEGESGILAISPPWDKPSYEPSKRRITWNNGAIATIYSGENPELSRGGQHEKAWFDELAKYKYPQDTYDNIMFGLRLGDNPQTVITTTPKPIKTIKQIIKDKRSYITRGSTFENKSNLADVFINTIVQKYEGTRLGRQELYAEILDDNPNALWTRGNIEKTRVTKCPQLTRIVVAIDPATTDTETSDEAGIIIAGKDANGHGYILDDKSIKASPDKWAREAVTAYHKWQADRVIGEGNNGGDMIELLLRVVDNKVSYKKVTASKGKYTRAEPIAALYEQEKIHHVGSYNILEDELCEWEQGDKSPNRLDALVWALTELMLESNYTWGFGNY